jgi:MFS family permease
VRAALAYARRQRTVRALLGLQAAALVFFTVSMPVEIVYAQRTFHVGAAGYGVLLSAWGAGAVAGSAIYMRWRALPSRHLLALGSGMLGAGFLVMAVAPWLAIGVAGAAVAGIGNGIESVSARTALQEAVKERWMALMMSFNESLAMFVPGIGIALGGAIAQLAGPRIAWLTAGVGALTVTAAMWMVLGPARERAPAPTGQAQHEGPAPRGSPSSAAPPV